MKVTVTKEVEATVDVDVDVDLGDFDTDDLIDELESRGESRALNSDTLDAITGKNPEQMMDALYEARVSGNNERALELVDRLLYAMIGRIV